MRHQLAMSLGLLCITLGTSAIIANKNISNKHHFVSVHAVSVARRGMKASQVAEIVAQKFGLSSFVWLIFQAFVGAGSVWFGGKLFGGGMKAKAVWKYHRWCFPLPSLLR